MSILSWLGLKRDTGPQAGSDPAQLDRIAAAMQALEPDHARYLAGFAYLLSRVAYADGVISRVETERMNRILRDFSELTLGQADLALQLARHETFASDAAVGRQVSAIFASVSTEKQREDLLGCLYAVAAADDVVHGVEDEVVMTIGAELGIPPDFVQRVRGAYARFLKV